MNMCQRHAGRWVGGGGGVKARSGEESLLPRAPGYPNVVRFGSVGLSVSDGSVIGGWLGRVCTTLHLHTPRTHLRHQSLFCSLVFWCFLCMYLDVCSQPLLF